ncbi:MAG: transcriptional repressor [Syntrophomonadaceae bacterium]|nr:transcriptional repressor [Syntrophomonadaceae bacterium]
MLSRYVLDKLENLSYKITPQRKAILQVLEENQGDHLSAEQIFLSVKKRMPNVGIATVYRTLDALANLGVLHKTSFDEGLFRYEFCEDDRHHHHHLVCVTCGNITEIEEDLLYQLERKVEDQGFKVIDHSLVIYGICQGCQ